jgi:hypothetical protein
LAITLLGAFFFAPALAGHCPMLRDLPGFTLPSRAVWQKAVLQGHLPAWNPLVGLGLPTAAPVNGTFYPGHLLLLAGQVVHALPRMLAVHAVLAGLGAYALARTLRCQPVAASVAAVAWMLGGYAVSMWGNGEKVLTDAWVPLAVAACVQAARVDRARSPWTVLAGTAFALVALAGDPFVWVDALGLTLPLTYVAARQDASGGLAPWAAWRRVGVRVGASVGLSLLLASPALLPAWLLRDDTRRALDLTLAASEQWSMTPVRLLELVAPGALGDPMHLASYPGAAFADDPAVQPLPWALSLYGGAACVCLPVLAGRRRASAALLTSALLGLLLALGRHTPAHAALRFVVFPLRWMRYPEKHAMVLVGALALLAGLGCERALRKEATLWHAAVVTGGLALVAWIAAPAELRSSVTGGLGHTLLGATALLGALALAVRQPRAAPVVVAVVALDVATASAGLLPWDDTSLERTPATVSRILAKPGPAPSRLLRPRHGAQTADSLPGNLASVWGIAELPGHDPARSVRLDQLASRLGGTQTPKLASLLRLDWALFPENETPDGQADWRLLESAHLPRAWVVGAASVDDDAAGLEKISKRWFEPNQQAVISPSPTASTLASGASGTCELLSYEPERVALSCNSSGDALAILADADAPGWTATVDGSPAAIERTNLVMRGVRMSAGSHRITFAYATPGLRWGFALAALGLLGPLSLALLARRHARA